MGKSMIDWLSTKLGALIALAVVTGFVLSLFAWQNGVLEDNQGQVIADSIADTINDLAGTEAATIIRPDLAASIGNNPYFINITSNMVILHQGESLWTANLIQPVICGNITLRNFNLTEYNELFYGKCTGEHSSDCQLIVENAAIEVTGQTIYKTIIYFN